MEGKDNLKILMTTDTVGGVWNYSLDLCRVLGQFDVQVHLAALGFWPDSSQEAAVRKLRNVVFYKSGFRLEWMKDPWEDVENSRRWINSIYQTIRPDIVHFNNYAHVEEEWTAPVLTVFHSCVQTWWQAVKGKSAPEEWDQYTQVVEDSLEHSDIVVAPTLAILEKAKRTHSFSSDSTVIPNGSPIPECTSRNKEKIILCMGRMWDEAKNLSLLSRIAGTLSWPVFVAGNRISPDTKIESSGENIQFLGHLSPGEVKNWMNRASIFVSPSHYEPFGLSILEAAGHSCALVLSNLDTLKEIWEGAALFFNPQDAVEAERKIQRLIQDPELLKSYSEKARSRAQEYSAERMGNTYFNLYKKLVVKEHKHISA